MIAGGAAVVILILLGILHVYWAAGGNAGKAAAIPTSAGLPVLNPSALGTALVALGLFAMATLPAVRVGLLEAPEVVVANKLVRGGAWLTAVVFAIRAVGDFRYAGFFKRVRDTRFAHLDTWIYSPFCAGMALLISIACMES
ncbi:MAG: DUF3995 domain-containing protein [bacterium]